MRKYRRYVARMRMYAKGLRQICKKDRKKTRGSSYFAQNWRDEV